MTKPPKNIHKNKENQDIGTLEGRLEMMRRVHVLVVGDIMLDRFVYGEAHRISPESPIPVLSIAREDLMLGGAGNVLANLAGLGVRAHILSVAGKDEAAKDLRALLKDRGVDTGGLLSDGDRPTTLKTRFLASRQQLLRADFEKIAPIPAALEKDILRRANKLLPQVGAVVLSDYGKGVLTKTVITGIIARARKHNVPVLVDPKGGDYSIYRGATLVTPNRKELSEAAGGLPAKEDAEVIAAAEKIIKSAGIDAVVATRSQDGMSIVRRKAKGSGFEPPVRLHTEALEVFDVSGAGDTVIATLAAALSCGADLIQAAALANVAAGIVVGKIGTAPIRREELLEALSRKELDIAQDGRNDARIIDRTREARLCTPIEALEHVRRWKARGLRVGFTNGCFDILHPGHVGYLNQARDRCDRLIVALNADESVRRLKGPGRPVNNEQARAAVIGALGAVDMVVIFGREANEDDKPLRMIKALEPDVYFKGGDYTEGKLPETPIVRAYGGRVQIMKLFEGHSTTGTIGRLKSSKVA